MSTPSAFPNGNIAPPPPPPLPLPLPPYSGTGRLSPSGRGPAADEPQIDLTAAFTNLRLSTVPGHPDANTCLAHLKLLAAFGHMKEEVGYTDGLWGIWDNRSTDPESLISTEDGVPRPEPQLAKVTDPREVLSKWREKRWALFVARAVDRYEAWWNAIPSQGTPRESDLTTAGGKYSRFPSTAQDLGWTPEMLPPLGEFLIFQNLLSASAPAES